MKKKELISRAAEILRQNDVRKTVPPLTKTFHITDDNDNISHFTVKTPAKGVLFSNADVAEVLDAILATIEECIRTGNDLQIRDFGTIGVRYRAARMTKNPFTGEPVEVAGRYIPKFYFGNGMRMAAKMYELSLAENGSRAINAGEEYDPDDDFDEDFSSEEGDE